MKTRSILSRVLPVRASCAVVFSAFITLVTAVGFPGSAAYASNVIYSDLGAGSATYQPCCYYGLGAGVTDYMLFTATTTADVSQIDAALAYVSLGTGPNQATVSLYTDSSNLPGAVLGSWTITSLPASSSTVGPLSSTSVSPGLLLTAGVSYFLSVTAPSSLQGAWYANGRCIGFGSCGAGGSGTYYFNNGSTLQGPYTSSLAAFDVLGGPAPATTPLPSTWLMLLSGFVGLGFFAYRGTKNRSAALAA
jgi:hypothetical protein